jgi:hypothetical protein
MLFSDYLDKFVLLLPQWRNFDQSGLTLPQRCNGTGELRRRNSLKCLSLIHLNQLATLSLYLRHFKTDKKFWSSTKWVGEKQQIVLLLNCK